MSVYIKQSSGWYTSCFLPTPVLGCSLVTGLLYFSWEFSREEWKKLLSTDCHPVDRKFIWFQHVGLAVLVLTLLLVCTQYIWSGQDSSELLQEADLHRYWAFEASRNFTTFTYNPQNQLSQHPWMLATQHPSLHPHYCIFNSYVKTFGHQTSSDNVLRYKKSTNTKYLITLFVNKLKPTLFFINVVPFALVLLFSLHLISWW